MESFRTTVYNFHINGYCTRASPTNYEYQLILVIPVVILYSIQLKAAEIEIKRGFSCVSTGTRLLRLYLPPSLVFFGVSHHYPRGLFVTSSPHQREDGEEEEEKERRGFWLESRPKKKK